MSGKIVILMHQSTETKICEHLWTNMSVANNVELCISQKRSHKNSGSSPE